MVARIDLSGQSFGRLTAIFAVTWGPTVWRCRCECGSEIDVRQGNLRNGHTRSCGCLLGGKPLHGHTSSGRNSRTFSAYSNAKTRCFNASSKKFSDYGGRGITMCARWRDSFSAFLADMGECPAGYTLERENVNGNYEPGNCRWATPDEQARNKRNNIWVDLDGKKVVLKDYAKAKGLNYHSLHGLMRYHGEPAHVIAARMLERKRTFENVARIIKR